MYLNEKISIEEAIDDEIEFDAEWIKYIACLCKNCGAEPGEPHSCEED